MGIIPGVQAFILRHYRTILIILIGLIIGLSFYLGYLEGKQSRVPQVSLACSGDILSALTIPTEVLAAGQTSIEPSHGVYVGSKNGTKYYNPGCATVKRIKPENYHWFKDAADAQLQGYTPGNC